MSNRRESSSCVPRATVASGFALALALACLLSVTAGSVWGAFSGQTANPGNEITAAPDFVAPSATRSVVQKIEGGVPGYIRPGGSYRVFANVTDSGNPASGVASVAAVADGASPVGLTFGAYSILGLTYNYRSASQTLAAGTGAGTYGYSVQSADFAANARTEAGFSLVVDATAPAASAIATANRTGGTTGRAELGDSITFTYDEPIDANSVVAGWTGSAATNVVVRLNNNVGAYGNNDTVAIYNSGNTAVLPLGTVNLGRNDFVSANRTFGVGATASTMTQGGNAFAVTLGTASGSTPTSSSNTTMTWWPSAGATDRAGNGASTASRTEAGTADREF